MRQPGGPASSAVFLSHASKAKLGTADAVPSEASDDPGQRSRHNGRAKSADDRIGLPDVNAVSIDRALKSDS